MARRQKQTISEHFKLQEDIDARITIFSLFSHLLPCVLVVRDACMVLFGGMVTK
jgi:hypothetical protein